MQVGWSCDHPTCIVVPERQPGKKKTEAHAPVRKSQHRHGLFFSTLSREGTRLTQRSLCATTFCYEAQHSWVHRVDRLVTANPLSWTFACPSCLSYVSSKTLNIFPTAQESRRKSYRELCIAWAAPTADAGSVQGLHKWAQDPK